jgi:hypothetical protein
MFTVIKSRVKSQTIIEVEHQGNQVIHLITESVRNAQSVESPIPHESGSTVSLTSFDYEENPTIISIVDGIVYLQEGSSDPVQITSSRILVTSLEISNISSDSRIFRISVEVTHRNPENKIEYNFTETFTGSAAIRNEYL